MFPGQNKVLTQRLGFALQIHGNIRDGRREHAKLVARFDRTQILDLEGPKQREGKRGFGGMAVFQRKLGHFENEEGSLALSGQVPRLNHDHKNAHGSEQVWVLHGRWISSGLADRHGACRKPRKNHRAAQERQWARNRNAEEGKRFTANLQRLGKIVACNQRAQAQFVDAGFAQWLAGMVEQRTQQCIELFGVAAEIGNFCRFEV